MVYHYHCLSRKHRVIERNDRGSIQLYVNMYVYHGIYPKIESYFPRTTPVAVSRCYEVMLTLSLLAAGLAAPRQYLLSSALAAGKDGENR